MAVVAIAQRMRSETVAGIALFLGLHSGMLSGVSALTLLATCLLAAGAVFFLVANRWVVVPASGLAAAYATHARWELAGSGDGAHALGLAFLGVYFALFSLAVLLRPAALDARGRALLPIANAAGLVALGAWELRAPGSGVALFLAAAATAEGARRYRVAGFAGFALTGARLLAIDLRRLGPDLRIATFLALGALLLGVFLRLRAHARRRGRAAVSAKRPGEER